MSRSKKEKPIQCEHRTGCQECQGENAYKMPANAGFLNFLKISGVFCLFVLFFLGGGTWFRFSQVCDKNCGAVEKCLS